MQHFLKPPAGTAEARIVSAELLLQLLAAVDHAVTPLDARFGRIFLTPFWQPRQPDVVPKTVDAMQLLCRAQYAAPCIDLGLLAFFLLATPLIRSDALVVSAQNASQRIDIELLRQITQWRERAAPRRPVYLALYELGVDCNAIRNVAKHVLLDRAAVVDHRADLAVHRVPRP